MADVTPGAARLVAPAGWRSIDLISDLHLAEDTPRNVAAFREHLRSTPADAVFILGDLFEVWVGDDARFDGFEAEIVALLREASARRWVGFMVGNRDFALGPDTLADCGVHRLDDPFLVEAFGTSVLLTHGDAWCVDDKPYQQFRAMVRNPAWQAEQLKHPLAVRRAIARDMRAKSAAMYAQRAPADWIDVDRRIAGEALAATGASVLIHGHTHRPSDDAWDGRRRLVLSDWDLDHGSPPRAEVMRWSAAGFERLAPWSAG